MNYEKRYQIQLKKYDTLYDKYKAALNEKKDIESRYSDASEAVITLRKEIQELRAELKTSLLKVKEEHNKYVSLNRRMSRLLKEVEKEFYRRFYTASN